MNQYERRFYEDIHKLVTIQKEILTELKKMNKPMEIDETRIPKVLTEDDLWKEEKDERI